MHVLSIGEILWDVFPEKELLGGAPLNFAANTVRLGGSASLITAVGEDERGRKALAAMERLGVGAEFVTRTRELSTGVAVVSTTALGEPHFEIPRPAAFDRASLSSASVAEIVQREPDWLYFGTLSNIEPAMEEMTTSLGAKLTKARCFYDMNLRPGSWNLQLVHRLCGIATVLKLNEAEAETLGASLGLGAHSFSLEVFCEMWAEQFELERICVTLGPAGCMVFDRGAVSTVPGYPTVVKDTVGAGDAFAAAFLYGQHRGWPVLEIARFANALGSIVASREGATPEWTIDEVSSLAEVSV